MQELIATLETARDRLNNALSADQPATLINQALSLVTQAIIEVRQRELDQLRRELATGARPLKLTRRGVPRKPRADAGKKRRSYKVRKPLKAADKKFRS